MTHRMISLAAGVLAISALPAAAAPLLSGAYTATGIQVCQVVTGGKTIDPNRTHGNGEQMAARISLTNGAGGASGTLMTADQWVSLIGKSGTVNRQTLRVPITLAVSGTANPYAMTLTMTTPQGKATQTGKIFLGNITGGIAGRAMFLTTSSNGQSTTPNCVMRVTLFRD